jgi:uncharacterized protein YcbK (DUF882 family)
MDIDQHKLKLWESTIKYFKFSEFDDKTEVNSGLMMNPSFVQTIDQIRAKLGHPLHINSGYRTESHNALVGGVPGSAHTKGLACDIECIDGSTRFQLIKYALDLGIKRIGIGDTFIHLDGDLDKPQEVIWIYPPGNGG